MDYTWNLDIKRKEHWLFFGWGDGSDLPDFYLGGEFSGLLSNIVCCIVVVSVFVFSFWGFELRMSLVWYIGYVFHVDFHNPILLVNYKNLVCLFFLLTAICENMSEPRILIESGLHQAPIPFKVVTWLMWLCGDDDGWLVLIRCVLLSLENQNLGMRGLGVAKLIYFSKITQNLKNFFKTS